MNVHVVLYTYKYLKPRPYECRPDIVGTYSTRELAMEAAEKDWNRVVRYWDPRDETWVENLNFAPTKDLNTYGLLRGGTDDAEVRYEMKVVQLDKIPS